VPTLKRRSHGAESVAFDWHKYGRRLGVDVSALPGLPNFIVAPRPHRLGFFELILIEGGRGSVDLDGVALEVAPGRLIATRPGEVRCWRLDTALRGWVVSFTPEWLGEFLSDAGFVDRHALFTRSAPVPPLRLSTPARRPLVALLRAMQAELRTHGGQRELLLRAMTLHWLALATTLAPAPFAAPARGGLVQRLVALVEQGFRREARVAVYARRLQVTPGHLSTCVRRELGCGAAELIERRRLLEARRLLLYGADSVAEVAAMLGFSDASHFVRFFKRRVGATPLAFRRAFDAGHGIGER
jgi:AraC-like DNA-binding protein